MKKFIHIVKNLLVLVLVFAGVVSAEVQWELITTTKEGTRIYIETNSITMLAPGRYLIWTETYPESGDRQKYMERELKGVFGVDKFAYTKSRVEIDCSTMRHRYHSIIYYSDNDNVLKIDKYGPSEWYDPPPGSYGDNILKRVCAKGYDAKEM